MNLTNSKDSSNIFFNVGNLKYVNIYNVRAPESFFKDITGDYGINGKDELTVCQDSKIITNPKDKYICCQYDLSTNSCGYSKYIKISYKESVEYSNGFIFGNDGRSNDGRKACSL